MEKIPMPFRAPVTVVDQRLAIDRFIEQTMAGEVVPPQLDQFIAVLLASVDPKVLVPDPKGRKQTDMRQAFISWFSCRCDPQHRGLPRVIDNFRSGGLYSVVGEKLHMTPKTVRRHEAMFESWRLSSPPARVYGFAYHLGKYADHLALPWFDEHTDHEAALKTVELFKGWMEVHLTG